MGQLALLDYVIVILYLAGTMAIGVWVSAYIRTGREFFLAGRTLPWWAVGMSLVATDIGGTDLIGVGGAAYRYGMAVGNFEWIGCVPAMIVGAFVFVPHFWRCGVTTIPEYLERRFHVSVRTSVAACWVIFMACNLGVMLLASAKLMLALAGWSVPFSILLVAAIVLFYTCTGGLAAVVYTDVLQGVVMIVGCLLVTVVGLWQLGGIGPLRERVEQTVTQQRTAADTTGETPAVPQRFEHFSLVLPVDTPSPYPWPAILFGLCFVTSPAYWIGNQAIIQRSLGARSAFEAKASYVWGALLKCIIPLAIAVPGLIAFVQFPDLADADLALPHLIGRLMPVGMKGVFLAAFLAALMSTVESYLNSAATILTNDFYLRFVRPSADERRILHIGRFVTVMMMIWGVGFAFWLITDNPEEQKGIYAIFQTLMSLFNGPAFGVLLAGLVSRQTTALGALAGFWTGVTTAASLYLFNHPTVLEMFQWSPLFQIADPFLYYSIWAFVMTIAVTAVVSYAGPAESAEKQRYALGGLKTESELSSLPASR